MNKVKIFTDSTVDLTKDLVEKYEIGVVPLYVNIEDASYLDGIEITTADLYRIVDEKQTLPKTSTAPVTDFVDAFTPWINDGYDIIFMGVSSKLSSTYQTAALAAREFDEGRVTLVDSLSLSTGTALQVVKAAELAKAGLDSKTIAGIVSEITPRVRASFIIDTLKYLHMGGRCSAIQLLASNVLKIHPQIIVKDGAMIVGAKFRGKWKNCLDNYYEVTVGDGSQIDPERVFITHSKNQETAEYFKQRMEKELNIKEILITEAGTVISSHCGPGTIGILYIEK